ncbi:hypothetical protein [Streptomyces sp. KL2]|uniref:hypothetical protein n=1 Tax=Streptomyces sp. KL2 TaxID=3050126 RepID=UPI00397ADBBB
MRTVAVVGASLAGVVAVGDCVNWCDPRAGLHRRVEHWTGAREHPGAAIAALLAGAADDRDVLAVHRRAGDPVAVLGMNQPRRFMCWCKQLAATASWHRPHHGIAWTLTPPQRHPMLRCA